MNISKNTPFFAALLLAAIVATSGCGAKASDAKAAESKATSAAPRTVQTAAATLETVRDGIATSGSFAAFESSKVAAEVEGVIDAIYVEAGQFVKEGAPLVRINPTNAALRLAQAMASEQQQALAVEQARTKVSGGRDAKLLPEVAAAKANWDAAEAELRAAQLEHERTRKLLGSGDVSRSEADRAQANWQMAEGKATAARQQYQSAMNLGTQDLSGVGVAQAQLASAKAQRELLEKQMRDTVVRAPFAGLVSARGVTKGEFVAVGAQVAVVEKVQPLRLLLQVPEAAAAGLRPGLELAVKVEGLGSAEPIKGKLTTIHPVVSPTNRTLTIEAHFDNSHGKLRPGMFATAIIQDEKERQALFVPTSAVLVDPSTDANLVWVVDKGLAKVRSVRLGTKRGNTQEITDGVAAGDQVISKPSATLFDGEPVTQRSSAAQ